MLRVEFEDNLISEIGRACLVAIGCKSRWWVWCRHICSKFGLIELVNLIWLRNVYCDIHNLSSSNNDVLNVIDPDI